MIRASFVPILVSEPFSGTLIASFFSYGSKNTPHISTLFAKECFVSGRIALLIIKRLYSCDIRFTENDGLLEIGADRDYMIEPIIERTYYNRVDYPRRVSKPMS